MQIAPTNDSLCLRHQPLIPICPYLCLHVGLLCFSALCAAHICCGYRSERLTSDLGARPDDGLLKIQVLLLVMLDIVKICNDL
jgi:hypothetical protein